MTTTKQEHGPRNFGVFLSQIEDGALQADLAEELQRANTTLAEHARNHGRKAKGSVTITIALCHDDRGVVDVDAEIKTKLPKSTRARTVFWDDGHGNLTNKNPKQETLNFKSVPGADSPAKDINVHGPMKEVSGG